MEVVSDQTGGELLRTIVWIGQVPLKSVLQVQVSANRQVDYDGKDHLSAISR